VASAQKVPLGLLPIPWPADNPYSPAKVELERLLYFDKRLSEDNTVSCATCHVPEKGFTDGAHVSTGIRDQKGGRSAPAVINRAYSLAQFWDGRAPTLEDQAKGPIANPIEMDNTHEGIAAKLSGIQGYRPLFQKAFGANAYANLGIGTDKPDTGRYQVTEDPLDWGKFKTPTLRDISKTGPYMRDGSLKTLEEVVDFYDKGGIPNKNLTRRSRSSTSPPNRRKIWLSS
jgi:cytochrome c peroxidase